MATKTKRLQSSIEVIDGTVASWSRAQLATARMHITGRVPDFTTTLIN